METNFLKFFILNTQIVNLIGLSFCQKTFSLYLRSLKYKMKINKFFIATFILLEIFFIKNNSIGSTNTDLIIVVIVNNKFPLPKNQKYKTKENCFFKSKLFSKNELIKPDQRIFHKSNFSFLQKDTVEHSEETKGKILTSGLIGSISFGLMGAIIGYSSSLHCSPGAEFNFCGTKGDNSLKGAAIGGTAGSIFGFTAHIKKIRKKKPFLRIVVGSVIGGIAGYYMSHKIPFGLSTLLLPPLVANVAINL